mmetsp:Transcript_8949/g.15332  ORF Transcript_8949/g.15332 Transcript_8949/m.15332 type:complete len:202 (-) Transcript_8949:255-860(-)
MYTIPLFVGSLSSRPLQVNSLCTAMRATRVTGSLFAQPGQHVQIPVHQLLLLEPQGDFLLAVLHAVTAMNHVPSDLDGQVPANGARLRLQGIGGANQLTSGLDHAGSLPHHADHGPGDDVVHKVLEERLRREVTVVRLRERLGAVEHLEALALEPLALEAPDDVAHQSPLNTIRLDHNVCPLSLEATRQDLELGGGGCARH